LHTAGCGNFTRPQNEPFTIGQRYPAMKSTKDTVAIWRLDEHRFAVGVDNVVRYVGSQEECQRRAAILTWKPDRDLQDRSLVRACALTH